MYLGQPLCYCKLQTEQFYKEAMQKCIFSSKKINYNNLNVIEFFFLVRSLKYFF